MSYHPEILPHLRGFAENGRWWPVSQHHSCRALVEADGCKGTSKVWFRIGRFKFKKVDWKQSQPKSVIYSGLTIQKGILSFNQFCSLFLVATGMTLPFAQIIPLDTPSSMSFIPHLQTTLSYSIWEKPNARLQAGWFKQVWLSSDFIPSILRPKGIQQLPSLHFPSFRFFWSLDYQMQCRDLTNKSWPQLRSSASSTVFNPLIDLLKLNRAVYKSYPIVMYGCMYGI